MNYCTFYSFSGTVTICCSSLRFGADACNLSLTYSLVPFSSRSWHFHFLSWSTYKIRPTIVVIVSDTGNAIHV